MKSPALRTHRFLFALLLLVTLRPAAAQWASLGDMPPPQRQGDTLTFRNAQGTVAVTAVTDDVIRVRFAPVQELGRDHSYAVVNPKPGEARARFEAGEERSEIITASLRVTLQHRPFRVSFSDARGESLDADDPAQGMAFSGSTVRSGSGCGTTSRSTGSGRKPGD